MILNARCCYYCKGIIITLLVFRHDRRSNNIKFFISKPNNEKALGRSWAKSASFAVRSTRREFMTKPGRRHPCTTRVQCKTSGCKERMRRRNIRKVQEVFRQFLHSHKNPVAGFLPFVLHTTLDFFSRWHNEEIKTTARKRLSWMNQLRRANGENLNPSTLIKMLSALSPRPSSSSSSFVEEETGLRPKTATEWAPLMIEICHNVSPSTCIDR